MIEGGLIEETERQVMPIRGSMPTALQAIGYKEVLEYLDGDCTLDEMKDKLKQNTRRYAKRQLTWQRRNKNINWLWYEDAFSQAEKLIKERTVEHETAD